MQRCRFGRRLVQAENGKWISVDPAGDLQPFGFGLFDNRFLLPLQVQEGRLQIR